MRLLYLEGDPNAIRYVSGTLSRLGVAHEVIGPGSPLPRDLSHFRGVILSDFPREELHGLERLIAQGVRYDGLGLMMVGGWRSFGHGGYGEGPLADLLPVAIERGDDRVCTPGGMVLEPIGEHTILRGLDLKQPVVICGHNRFVPRDRTASVLSGREIVRGREGVGLSDEHVPLLVLGETPAPGGRTAALAFDLAPHWSGGLTDWGKRTLNLEGVEVGEEYAKLVMNLVRWIAGEETVRRSMPPLEELTELSLEMPPIRCGEPK